MYNLMYTDLEHNYEDADRHLLEAKQDMNHMDFELNPAYTVIVHAHPKQG